SQPINHGFETGDLSGWSSQGSVEVLQASEFTATITPPEGQYFVLLSTGPDDLNPAPDNGDLDGNYNDDYDVTILSQTFTSDTGTISFSWSWLTDEETYTAQEYDDIFLVRLDGEVILSGSVDKTPVQSPFPNTSTDDVAYSVDSSGGSTDQSYFGDGRSVFENFLYPISQGTHTIEFIVADAGDDGVDSGLLIDNLRSIMGQTTDSSGKPREDFLTREAVYAVGGGFLPGTSVNIYIVNHVVWADGMAIPFDVSSDGMNTVSINPSGGFGPIIVWPAPLTKGSYDIVFDANQNGQYDAGIDFVDHISLSGFTISGFPTYSAAVGGIVVHISKVRILAPWISIFSLFGLIIVALILIKRRI
ncbi:MAG: choice-of-anchor L domain-containing protein, partial [Candidatus Bathyarchaeota archaeon]|nr:choice-of-anchor L domain-containing protein [Candidatus Bathyarchaeota archaeon]